MMNHSPTPWRFNKDISIADVVSFVTAALAVFYAYTTLATRLDLLERHLIIQAQIDKRQDDDYLRTQARRDQQLQEINTKLDRLIEKMIESRK